MKIIFIRGLPGTGKTAVAEILKTKLPNSELISVDNFKLKSMSKGKDFKTAKNFAYNETLKKLYKFNLMKKDYCIVEELICEEEFLKKLYEFINKTNADHYWFRVMRKLKDLLEVESKRDRKIKNTVEDFNKLKEDTKNTRRIFD